MTITDIEFETYKALNNHNYFYHKVMLTAFNLARYVSITFRLGCYQVFNGKGKQT